MANDPNPDIDPLDSSADEVSLNDSAEDVKDPYDPGVSSASILDDEETLDDLAELSAISGLDDFDDDSIELGVAGEDDEDDVSVDASMDASIDDSADFDRDASYEMGQPQQVAAGASDDDDYDESEVSAADVSEEPSIVVGRPQAVGSSDAGTPSELAANLLSGSDADLSSDLSDEGSSYELPGGDDSEFVDVAPDEVSIDESEDMSRNLSFELGRPELVNSSVPESAADFAPPVEDEGDSDEVTIDPSTDASGADWTNDESAGALGAPQAVGGAAPIKGDFDQTMDAIPPMPVDADDDAEAAIDIDDLDGEFDDEGESIAEDFHDDVDVSVDLSEDFSGDQSFELGRAREVSSTVDVDPNAKTLDESDFGEAMASDADVSADFSEPEDEPVVAARPARPEVTRRPATVTQSSGGGAMSALAHVATAVVSVGIALALVHFGIIGATPGNEQPQTSPTAALELQSQANQTALEEQQQTVQALQTELQRLEQARQEQSVALEDAQAGRDSLQQDIVALRNAAAAPASPDMTQTLIGQIHDSLITRGVADRLRDLDTQWLAELQQQQRTADAQTLAPFFSDATGDLDIAALESATEDQLRARLDIIRGVESRLSRWELHVQTSLVAALRDVEQRLATATPASAPADDGFERGFLKSSIETLFTEADQWVEDVEQLEGAPNQARWKAIVDKASALEIEADGTWADEPQHLSNSELRSWLLALQAIRLETQSVALAQVGQAASQASADANAALAKLTTTPTPADPDTPKPPTPPPADTEERKELIAWIRASVTGIRARLDRRSLPVVPGTEPEETPPSEEPDEVASLRELIADVDDAALASATLPQLESMARRVRQTWLWIAMLEHWDLFELRLAERSKTVGDQVATLATTDTQLADQLTADREKLVALKESQDTLSTKLTTLDRNTATKLTELKDSLTATLREEIRNVSAPKPEEVRQLIAAGVQAELREWGYVLPEADTTPMATVSAETPNPGRARQLFREAYTRVFFSNRDDAADESVRVLTQAVRHDPQNPLYRYFLGLSLYRLGKGEQAIEQIRIAATIEFQAEDESPGLNQWLERVQHGQRMWLERIRRDVRIGL